MRRIRQTLAGLDPDRPWQGSASKEPFLRILWAWMLVRAPLRWAPGRPPYAGSRHRSPGWQPNTPERSRINDSSKSLAQYCPSTPFLNARRGEKCRRQPTPLDTGHEDFVAGFWYSDLTGASKGPRGHANQRGLTDSGVLVAKHFPVHPQRVTLCFPCAPITIALHLMTSLPFACFRLTALLLLAPLPGFVASASSAELPPMLPGVHRILFLGDSITYAGQYNRAY